MSTTARVVADSISTAGHRLTTIEVVMHRFVLAEFNTHRVFSRNSASSRAIPAATILRRVADDPAVPLAWPAEQRGMQGGDDLPAEHAEQARTVWLSARDAALNHAMQLIHLGVHKSVVNRLLEPYLYTTVIVTATDWVGFWAQRCSPLAQPEIQAAAEAMRTAYDGSTPELVAHGGWHLPYLDPAEENAGWPLDCLQAISAARCARGSYLTQDRRDPEADLRLYDRLVHAEPPHASPLEHVATPAGCIDPQVGNLRGWHQLRHQVLR